MKQIIKNYSFNASNKTVTLTDFITVSIDRLLLITNVTTHTVLYQFNNPTRGGTAAGNTLTLVASTAGMSNTDKLQIIYDCMAGDPVYDAFFDPSANANVNLATALAGEDLTNNVLGVLVKPAITAEYDLSFSTAFGTSVAVNPKATPGNVYGFFASNENTTKRYFQIHNKSAVPTVGNVPLISIPIPGGTADAPGSIALSRDMFGDNGHYCSNGIAWGISTTRGTYTAATPSEHDVMVTYI
jgi:hypothetical protein